MIPLKMFGTGQVTLPKGWREKVKSMYFIAEETPQGLLIKPLVPNIYLEINKDELKASKLAKKLKKEEWRQTGEKEFLDQYDNQDSVYDNLKL